MGRCDILCCRTEAMVGFLKQEYHSFQREIVPRGHHFLLQLILFHHCRDTQCRAEGVIKDCGNQCFLPVIVKNKQITQNNCQLYNNLKYLLIIFVELKGRASFKNTVPLDKRGYIIILSISVYSGWINQN